MSEHNPETNGPWERWIIVDSRNNRPCNIMLDSADIADKAWAVIPCRTFFNIVRVAILAMDNEQ